MPPRCRKNDGDAAIGVLRVKSAGAERGAGKRSDDGERGTLREPSWPGLVASDRANSDDGEIDHGTAERKTENGPVR